MRVDEADVRQVHGEWPDDTNYQVKLRAIRKWCLELYEMGDDEFVNAGWVESNLMCVLKYGPGFEQGDLDSIKSRAPGRGWLQRLRSIFHDHPRP